MPQDRHQPLTGRSRREVHATRPEAADDGTPDFVDEVRRAFQPLSADPLTRQDAAEIIDNLGRFGALLQRWALRRAARADALAGAERTTREDGGLGGPS